MSEVAYLDIPGMGEPEELSAQFATSEFFKVLGVDPILGRTFPPDDAEVGRHSVAVLSYGLWQRRFGGQANVVGRQITLNDSNGGYFRRDELLGRFAHPRDWIATCSRRATPTGVDASTETRFSVDNRCGAGFGSRFCVNAFVVGIVVWCYSD